MAPLPFRTLPLIVATLSLPPSASCFAVPPPSLAFQAAFERRRPPVSVRWSSSTTGTGESSSSVTPTTDAYPAPKKEDDTRDFDAPDDAVIHIKQKAMNRLRELKAKRDDDPEVPLVLRMGVRNGGCSGLSYVMDFSDEKDITDDDAVDEYPSDGILCVVDAKSMLYLYGLELDYSEELIGGGFKFFNPNAEESCGCGSSFGV